MIEALPTAGPFLFILLLFFFFSLCWQIGYSATRIHKSFSRRVPPRVRKKKGLFLGRDFNTNRDDSQSICRLWSSESGNKDEVSEPKWRSATLYTQFLRHATWNCAQNNKNGRVTLIPRQTLYALTQLLLLTLDISWPPQTARRNILACTWKTPEPFRHDTELLPLKSIMSELRS